MPRKVKYTPVQIAEGKWYRIRGYTHHECCDCGLVHKEQYRMNDGHVEWRAMRDDAQTAKRRKELGIKVSREA
jgi:transcription initiation factor TFIIIB Brf1 subunit/transcription initiation factor TFIIB